MFKGRDLFSLSLEKQECRYVSLEECRVRAKGAAVRPGNRRCVDGGHAGERPRETKVINHGVTEDVTPPL